MAKRHPEKLLKIFDFNNPPYNPFKLAEKLEINIDRTLTFKKLTFEKIGHSGSISVKNNDATIWVNRWDIEERQRFTVAHEIGHYILHILPSQEEKHFIDTPESIYGLLNKEGNKTILTGANTIQELEATIFASELLMPKKDILAEAEKIIDASEGKPIKVGKFIAEMARIFVVSKQQMLNKLKACDLVSNNYKL